MLKDIYAKIASKVPFNPVSSLNSSLGLNEWKKIYSYSEPETDDKDVRKVLKFAWENKFHVRPGTTPKQLEAILSSLKKTKGMKGDVMEFGTYKGGTSIYMKCLMDLIDDDRRLYLCDTFEGFPYDDPKSASICAKKGFLRDTKEKSVLKLFQKNNLNDNLYVVKGKFEDTLQNLDVKISFAFIDCDMYQSGKYVLDFVTRHLINHANICIHDVDTGWGIKQAFTEQSILQCHNFIEGMGESTYQK